jgi:glutamyl-tRNA(Gln) amidotransferase subunit E
MEDWGKLGLKAGLECHQQLDTGKLFCRCPSVLREDKPDFIIRRKIRAVASELGEYDKAALEAFGKDLTFVYQGYKDNCCLVETDSEPPHLIDKEAFETVLKVALMSNAQILDELFVMRKTVIEGSVVSGFQRTMLVAVGGSLELSNKKVGILSIALEEDAARPMERRQNEVVYRLDRLGIPLIELATAPDLKSPEEVKECAQKIGELFRRTCRAKRGLGTIRQDVNISIAEGARVEIKGVQDLGMIDEYVRKEVQRQLALVGIKEEMKKRKIAEKDFEKEFFDVSQIFANSECKFLKGKPVFGTRLHKMAGVLGREVQPGRRFGTELAGYVKARTGLKGIVHSDELPAYDISEREVEHVRHKCNCVMDDGFVLVQADKTRAENALAVVLERSEQALEGVPEETRNALENGNTEYSRPLPGAARMYPETDLAPITLEKDVFENLSKNLPLSVEERQKLYSGKGLSGKQVEEMKLSNEACFFERLLKKGLNATLAATALLEIKVKLRREGIEILNETIEELLLAENKGDILKESIENILRETHTKTFTVDTILKKTSKKSFSADAILLKEAIKEAKAEKVSEEEVKKVIADIIEKNKDLAESQGMHALGALMGDAMKELRGRADGATISRMLKEGLAKRGK